MNRAGEKRMGASQFALLLHSVPHLGEKTLTRLFHLCAQNRLTPEDCLALSEEDWRNFYDLDPRAASYLCERRAELLARTNELARQFHLHPLRVLTRASAAYPSRLERFSDTPPPILYALGALSLLDAAPNRFTFTLAVSNGAAPEALSRLDALAAALTQEGGVPVTGHDRPPYKRLALAAQRRNQPILYLFDRGLREALGPDFDRPPFAAARIREAVFLPERDLALSPFRLDDHGLGANNKIRDRLIFALSDLIVALDIRAGGSMAEGCRRAQEQGRPVYVAAGGRDGNGSLRALGCPPLPDAPEEAASLLADAWSPRE